MCVYSTTGATKKMSRADLLCTSQLDRETERNRGREVLSVTAPEPCGICIIIYYICVVCTRKLANLEYGRVYT